MKNIVQLTLTGRQLAENGEESLSETNCTAEYYERNGSIYLLYQEIPEEMDTAIQNCIKLHGSVLEITKKGAINTRMVFEAGQEYLADYATLYGCMKIGIRTDRVCCLRQEESLTIQTEYTLTSQGQPFARCSVTISVLFTYPC